MTGPTVRRLIFGLIVLVLAGDVAAVVALRSDADTAQGAPATSTIAPTTTATTRPVRSAVILRDDFGSATAYQSGDEPSARSTTGDGQLRLLFRRNLDIYKVLPPAAPEHDRIQSVRDVHLSIEARFLAGAPEDEFGLVCRHHGLDADTYLGAVAADGTWGIYRATLGSKRGPYVRRPLVTGREPGLSGTPSPDAVHRIGLDCVGGTLTTIRLHLNGREIGRATDTDGLGPANAGFFASSFSGEWAFDNLVVAELSE